MLRYEAHPMPINFHFLTLNNGAQTLACIFVSIKQTKVYPPFFYFNFAAIASAAFTTFDAIFSEAASIKRPSKAAAPFP